ncbi:MAG TPA: SAM-dependent methyltransferase [Pseudonocardiaceae bacterium]
MEAGTGPLAGVAKTALGMAMLRAEESRRPERLFDDPYAAAFLAAASDRGDAVAFASAFASGIERHAATSSTNRGANLGAQFAVHGVLRTRFYDDYLLAAPCRQVVLLAAGLDTRAYRLAWPDGVRLFELDLPAVLAFKERVLADAGARPRCERVALAVDLRSDWAAALRGAGFEPDEPAAWLVEGLLIYLTADEARRLLSTVGVLAAPGSRLACEHGDLASSQLLALARATPAMAEYTALWRGGLGAAVPALLGEHGWRVRRHDLAEVAARYGRPVPASSSGGFVTAVRG